MNLGKIIYQKDRELFNSEAKFEDLPYNYREHWKALAKEVAREAIALSLWIIDNEERFDDFMCNSERSIKGFYKYSDFKEVSTLYYEAADSLIFAIERTKEDA